MSSTVSKVPLFTQLFAQAEPPKDPVLYPKSSKAPTKPAIRFQERAPLLMKGFIRFQPFANIQRNMKLLDQTRMISQENEKNRLETEKAAKMAREATPLNQYDVNQTGNPHVDSSRGR